jgi:hypothetical protein
MTAYISKDKRLEKQCTKCKQIKPNNTDFFRLDSNKIKLNHTIVLSSQCIVCKEKRKSEYMKEKRAKARERGTTLYSELSDEKKKYLIKWNTEYGKRNKDRINEMRRYRRKTNTKGCINARLRNKEKSKRDTIIMTNYYIARLVTRNNKELTVNELYKYPQLLDLHRANLKLKRICRTLET